MIISLLGKVFSLLTILIRQTGRLQQKVWVNKWKASGNRYTPVFWRPGDLWRTKGMLKLIDFPLQKQFQCDRISRRQAICLHGMARQNCIRQFVTILSLNKTRDLKTEGFCTGSLCWKKPFFCMGTFCVLFLCTDPYRGNKLLKRRTGRAASRGR